MNFTNSTSNSIPNRTQALLLFTEWFSLLVGLLLCMPTKEYYPGLYLVLPLLAASWIARWARISRLTRPTAVDIPLLLFLLSLLLGFFVAPNPATAFARQTLFLVAFSLFYALVNSPSQVIDQVLTLLIIVLAFSGPFFISQYDWSLGASRYLPLEVFGGQLNQLIPDLNLELPAWNTLRNLLASILGLFLPILALQLYRGFAVVKRSSKYSRRWYSGILKLALLVLCALLMLLALILTESRAPWLVYAAVLVLALWWWLSRRIGAQVRQSIRVIFISGILLVGLLLLVFIVSFTGNDYLAWLLPSPDTLTGRLEIYSQSLYLVADTPYTGGGLGAFPALYSFYIRGIPFDAFFTEDTGNNIYLQILVEQGVLGLFSLVLLLGLPLYIGLSQIAHINTVDNKELFAVGLTGTVYIILYGLIHATLGASRAIPFLMLPAGLLFTGLGYPSPDAPRTVNHARRPNPRLRLILLLALALPLLTYLLLAPAPRAAWYANLGALRMARVQLAGWPPEAWEDGSRLPDLAPAQALFHQALALNPQNRTANHRLGLIALLRQDFPMAVSYLETAHTANPDHRGITKSLGYARVWAGEVERGLELLRSIPETPQELDAYIFFWQTLDRPDVSDLAAEARARLSK